MIDRAGPGDREAVRRLFDLCFPGEEQFGDWFFRRVWRPEQTWLWRQAGEPAAMVQLLPVSLWQGEEELPAAYVYALGTHPAARGQGLARQLLDRCKAIAGGQGREALLLIPQQPSLFAYYSRQGYRTAFWAEQALVQAGPLPPEVSLRQAGPRDAAQMADFYRRQLADRLYAARRQREFQLQLELYQDHCWLACRQGRLTGWAFLEQEGRQETELLGAEAFGPDGLLAASGALARLGGQSCLCRGIGWQGEKLPFAMALPLTGRAAQALDRGSGYCNLLFN